MKCPSCKAWTNVLDTRDGRRRRECANGHRFVTLEVEAGQVQHLLKERRYRMAVSRLKALGYLR